MFYTGSSNTEKGLVQRIGLAVSNDLLHWEKLSSSPVIEVDPQWYEQLDLKLWHDQSWRDPWIFRHPTTGDFHAFITARVNYGPVDERGVIAHARSADLFRWEVLPPVTTPGDFGVMEVPQLVFIEGRYYLLFSAYTAIYSARRLQRTNLGPLTGSHYLVADDPLGPFHYITDDFLVGDDIGSLFSGKLVQGPNGEWLFMAFRNFNSQGEFIGEIIDPLSVKVDDVGILTVE